MAEVEEANVSVEKETVRGGGVVRASGGGVDDRARVCRVRDVNGGGAMRCDPQTHVHIGGEDGPRVGWPKALF